MCGKRWRNSYAEYLYDTTAASGVYTNGLRQDRLRMPSLHAQSTTPRYQYFDYTDTVADALHRVSGIREDFSTLAGTVKTVATYGYNGTGNLVEVSLPQPATPVKQLRDEGADGVYENLDRFGRIKTQHWKAAATTVERVDYTYDTAGNRLLRDVPVAGRDQSYSYDMLHRLRSTNQGTWNGSSITSAIQQLWNLDLLGNWNNLTEVPGISQNRTHNNANEILSLNSSSTSVAHDESGNMTRVPRQADWSNYFELKYDAWNRLTEVKLGTTVIGSYAYDGLHRRISRTFTVGSTTTTEQYYYNENWQCIEVRTGTESGPTTQKYVWHPYYIDALAARYWDGNGDNDVIDVNESHFPLHDGNFNVTALLDSAGTLFERYFYSAYGQLSVFDAAWTAQTSSIVANPYTYTGRQFDAESGIYQYRYRYYHAQLGRFVGRDPVIRTSNLYSLVSGRPIEHRDPLGLFEASVTIEPYWPDTGKDPRPRQESIERLRVRLNILCGQTNRDDPQGLLDCMSEVQKVTDALKATCHDIGFNGGPVWVPTLVKGMVCHRCQETCAKNLEKQLGNSNTWKCFDFAEDARGFDTWSREDHVWGRLIFKDGQVPVDFTIDFWEDFGNPWREGKDQFCSTFGTKWVDENNQGAPGVKPGEITPPSGVNVRE